MANSPKALNRFIDSDCEAFVVAIESNKGHEHNLEAANKLKAAIDKIVANEQPKRKQ